MVIDCKGNPAQGSEIMGSEVKMASLGFRVHTVTV